MITAERHRPKTIDLVFNPGIGLKSEALVVLDQCGGVKAISSPGLITNIINKTN